MEAWDGLEGQFLVRTGTGETPSCPYSDTPRILLWNRQQEAAQNITEQRQRIDELNLQIEFCKKRIDIMSTTIDDCQVAINKLS